MLGFSIVLLSKECRKRHFDRAQTLFEFLAPLFGFEASNDNLPDGGQQSDLIKCVLLVFLVKSHDLHLYEGKQSVNHYSSCFLDLVELMVVVAGSPIYEMKESTYLLEGIEL